MKQLKTLSFLFLFLNVSLGMSQDIFIWNGTNNPGGNLWNNPDNWIRLNPNVPANIFPGLDWSTNPGGVYNDVVIFTDMVNTNCEININHSGTTNVLTVGGMLVVNYTGEITQMDGNRFMVSESGTGSGPWSSISLPTQGMPSGIPNATLNVLQSRNAYEAYFAFGQNGVFTGSNTITGGNLDYSLFFAVPLTIRTGTFIAPRDEMRLRYHTEINPVAFDALTQEGTTVLSSRINPYISVNYSLIDVEFFNLKTSSQGLSYEFDISNPSFTNSIYVRNDFITGGVNGATPGAGKTVLNGSNTVIYIDGDIDIQNTHTSNTEFNSNAYGSVTLALSNPNPLTNQNIFTVNTLNYTGILPSVRIERPFGGNVMLHGPVTIQNNINFVNGVVLPAVPSVSMDDLSNTDDMFVINRDATITGGSVVSYCAGPIRVRRAANIILPLGKNDVYNPLQISNPTGLDNNTNLITAEYFDLQPSVGLTTSSDLTSVQDCEVWAIQKDVHDNYSFNLGLDFINTSANCPLSAPACEYAVARWNGTSWASHGNGGLSANNLLLSDINVSDNTNSTLSNFVRSSTQTDLFTIGELTHSLCDQNSCDIDISVDYCYFNCEFDFSPNISTPGAIVTSFAWDFGDGTPINTLQYPSHSYNTTGVFTVTLDVTVTLPDGTTCTEEFIFSVYNHLYILSSSSCSKSRWFRDNKFTNTSKSGYPRLYTSSSFFRNQRKHSLSYF